MPSSQRPRHGTVRREVTVVLPGRVCKRFRDLGLSLAGQVADRSGRTDRKPEVGSAAHCRAPGNGDCVHGSIASDSNPGELMMALLGWGFTVWMCVKASGSLKGKTQIGVRTASIPTEDRQAPARPRPWLLVAALLFGLTASTIGSAWQEGLSTAGLTSFLLGLLVIAILAAFFRFAFSRRGFAGAAARLLCPRLLLPSVTALWTTSHARATMP